MKLISLLLFISVGSIFAGNSYSQSKMINLNLTEVTVKDVIAEIEDQSEFCFMYSGKIIDLDRKISLSIKDLKIYDVLDQLFTGTDVKYVVKDRFIVLTSEDTIDELIVADNQQRIISGTVRDDSGEPLPGVTIVVKGTTKGTITDIDGNYLIADVGDDNTLVFSFIGMLTQEIIIGNQTNINVTMLIDAIGIEEVVAIGYGTLSRSELTAAVGSVASEEMVERTTAFNIMESMAGKVAGVRNVSFSGKPGGGSTLRIRGMGSINAGADPIYVLDGVVGIDPRMINSANVESIDILKDAAATAMYGAKGSNGVVLITTKSGKGDKGTLSYNGKVGVGFLNRKIDVLNANEYMDVQKRAYAYSGKIMPHLENPMENLFYYEKDALGNYTRDNHGNLIASPKYDTDWQEALTQNAITNDHNISFSSGNDNTSMFASIGYQDFEGLVKYTYSKRLSGTINVRSDINRWLNVQAIVTSSSSKRNEMEGGFGQGPVRNMIEMPPIVPVEYEDGTLGRKNDYPLGEPGENPILLLQEQKKIWDENFTVFNLISTFKLHKNLTLTVKGDYQTINQRNINYAKAGLLDVSEINNGYADILNVVGKKWSNEDYLSYDNSFFDNKLKSSYVLGASWYYERFESNSAGSENYFDDYFEYHNLAAGTTYHQPTSSMSQNTMNSYYFRMNQSFNDRYLLGATLRLDGASNFGDNNKYGFFPSASLAWRISEENFFQSAKNVMNNLKLRLSYGSVGNAAIPNYRTISSYQNGSVVFNNTLKPYVVLGNLGNEDLKWETSTQFNIGTDIALWDNRLEIIMDYYNKSTHDLLFMKQVPYTTGYSNTWTNLGEIVNEGFEFTMSSRNIDYSNFKWKTNFIFSTNKLKVVDIGGETIDTGNETIAKEGEEWASHFVLNRIGTWGLDEIDKAAIYGKKPGDLKFEDVDGNGILNDDDRKIMGNGLPKGDMTLVNTFSYKGLSLMIDLNYNYGAKILGVTSTMMENRQIYGNSRTSVLDAWTPENQNTMIAAIRLPSDVYFGENEKDSRMIYNGDFLRIRNIAISYEFNSRLLKKTKAIKSLNLGVNIENAHVFSSFPGFDPELGMFSADTGQGIEFYSYPRPTTISCNIKITF